MPRFVRRLAFDRATGLVKDTTSEEVRAVCDEISKSVEPYKEPLEFGNGRSRAKWPIHSEAMAIDPEDVPGVKAALAKRGLSVDYDHDGCPILENQSHRKRYMAEMGFYDRNAGYGDQAPQNYVESLHSPKAVKAARENRRAELRREAAALEREIFGF